MTTQTQLVGDVRQALSELTALLPGQVLIPGDPGWEELSRGWIVSVDQRPYAVVTVTDEEDTVAVVRWAARNGVPVAAQPVGHGATTALSDTVILRTRELREISIDVERQTARVGAGAKWSELMAATGPLGLTGLPGSSGDTSVVGFTLGGGASWFGRAFGLAAHDLLAVDLVDVNGELRRVTAASDPSLFWALRGGGGDFGIVTAVEIALHAVPHVYGGRLMWPLEMARPVLAAFREVTRNAPEELTLWAHLLRFPPLPEIPEPMRGAAFVTVDVTYLGDGEDAEPLLAPLRSLPALWVDSLGTVPLSHIDSVCAEPVDPMPTQEMSGLLWDFDDVAIDALLKQTGASSGSPLAVVQIRHLGGALARGTLADGPAAAIEEPYQLFCLGVPMTPAVAADVQGTFTAIKEALSAQLSGRTLFNFLACDDDPRRAFGEESLERLRTVKRCVDPAGIVRSNRPVLPVSQH